jgi:hypothetical protein
MARKKSSKMACADTKAISQYLHSGPLTIKCALLDDEMDRPLDGH